MGLDTTELVKVQREILDPQIATIFNKARVLQNLLDKADKGEINARGTKLIAKVRPNYSKKWFAEGGIYPNGGNETHINMTVNYTRFGITTRLTRDVLEEGSKTTVVNMLTDAVSGDTETALREMNEQSYGDGSGVKAVAASVSSQVVTMRSSAADVSPDNGNHADSYGSELLEVNGIYDIIAGSVRGSYAAIGDKVSDSNTITAKTSKTAATFGTTLPSSGDVVVDGDMVVLEDSYNIALNGLDYHISSGTGTYQGASRSTYPELRCYVLNASNSALTVAMLYKLVQQAKYLRGNDVLKENYIIISSPAQVHQYALLGDVSNSNYNGSATSNNLNTMPADQKVLDFGYTAYRFGGLTWIEDPHAPDHSIYVIMPSKFKVYEFKPLGMVFKDDGLMPVPAFTSGGVGSYADARLYTMTWKGNIGCKDPATAGMKISNLATSGLAKLTNSYAL